ncbi:MAG: type II toxin-antitoxin system VapC family toxin [Terriglobales bacterium]
MKLLLDSQLLVWGISTPAALPLEAARLLEDRRNEIWFSAASMWELAIKSSRRRRTFEVDVGSLRADLLGHGYFELSVDGRHGIASAALPWLHRDPFDRVLLAQAMVETMLLLTTDTRLARYPGPVRVV